MKELVKELLEIAEELESSDLEFQNFEAKGIYYALEFLKLTKNGRIQE